MGEKQTEENTPQGNQMEAFSQLKIPLPKWKTTANYLIPESEMLGAILPSYRIFLFSLFFF